MNIFPGLRNISRLVIPGLLLVLSALSAITASAQTEKEQEDMDRILSVLTTNQPEMMIQTVSPSPVPGMYVVTVMGMQTIFVTEDGKYYIAGDLFEALPSGVLVDTGAGMKNDLRIQLISQVDESEMIVYPAEGESLATLHVFTDLDCPYCRQFHGDIEELNENGITVRYLAFPRQGLEGDTYTKMVSTWCSETPNLYLTTAKRGADIPEMTCDNPVAKHYTLGHQMGIQGTPALLLETGELLNGYVPAESLIPAMLEQAELAAESQ
jgi:thiol:disulfide interchange protein DsbC